MPILNDSLGTLVGLKGVRQMPVVLSPDGLHAKVLGDLAAWTGWLGAGKRGFIGEFGWPYDRDVAQWNYLAGRYLDQVADASGTTLSYGVLATDNFTPSVAIANLKAPAAIGATHAHVMAVWDRLQLTNGGALHATAVQALIDQIVEAKRLGMRVILEPALQYPPSWVLSSVPKYQQQSGATWDDTGPGYQVRDWVWDATGWTAVSDFLTKLMAALPLADIERIRLGGGYYGEVHYPPTQYQAPKWWGFSAAAQGSATLAPHAVVAPTIGYTPYTGGGAVQDAAWVDWYIKSLGRLVRAQIVLIQGAGFTGKIHVLHPGYQLRSNWAVDSDAYLEAASAGEDVARQVPQYADLANVYPWCTWVDNDHYASQTNPTVDSDKATWLKIKEVAVANGVGGDLWGENTGNVDQARFDLVWGARGAVVGGYKGIMWLDHTALSAGSRVGYNRFANAAATTDRRMLATPWAVGRAWGNLNGPGQHYELAQMTNLVGNEDIVATLDNAAPVIARTTDAGIRLGYNLSAFEFGANSNQDIPYVITHSQADFTYLANQGIRLVRLPMAWERMQPTLGAALSTTALSQLTTMLGYAANAGIGVILDLHNYARYTTGSAGSYVTTAIKIDTGALTQAHLVDFWSRISDAYKDNPTVIGYDIMNEPYGMAGETLPGTTSYDEVLRYGFETTSPTVTEGWVAGQGNTSATRNTSDSGRTGVGILQSTKTNFTTGAANEWYLQNVTTPLAGGAFSGRYLSMRIKWAGGTTPTSGYKARLEYRAADGVTWVNNGTYVNLLAQGTMTLVTSTFGTDIPSTITGLRIAIRSENVGAATEGTFLIDEIRAERKTVSADTPVSAARVWEIISQAVVSQLRSSKNDPKLILVPGYQYSKTQEWLDYHAAGWITDSANNFVYTSHHYFDVDEDSTYGSGAYAVALAAA